MPLHSNSSRLTSALLAALIAVLVWVFAEGESISSRSVIATVNFASEPVGDLLVRPDDPGFHGTASVTLEGATRTIDAAAMIVGNKFRLAPGVAGVPTTPGEARYVDLREVLANLPELRDIGSTVASVEPRRVNVHVIRLVSRELPVRLDLGAAGGGVVLDSEPVCTPATITIRVPEGMAGRIPEGATVSATIADADLRQLRADVPQSVPAIVHAPEGLAGVQNVVLSAEQVTVTLRLKRTVDTIKVPTVPVWFSMPPSEDSGKWIVELQDKFITDVTLSGPSDQLQRIRSGEWPVKAMIELSSDDLAKGIQCKPAVFPNLPPGVSAAANSPIVRLLRVVKRDAK